MRIIDVIDHTNVMDDEFTYREPQQGSGDWRFGSQVIVGESQVAVFVRGGEALDDLRTGRHTISVANIPILASLIGLATSGRTPFTADLYFINLKDMPQVGWGTNPPIPMETPGKGMGAVLLSTFGTMSIAIAEPNRFLKKFAIGKPVMRLGDIKNAIQTKLLGTLTILLMQSGAQSVMDANKFLGELEGAMLAKLSAEFEDELGIQVKSIDANPFNAKQASPDELMNYVSADVYERMKKLQIAQTAAGNPGGAGTLVGAGLGLGVGQGMGSMFQTPEQQAAAQQQQMMNQMMMQKMMEMMNNNQQQPPAAAPAAAPANPQTKAEVEALIAALEMRLANGEISETVYNKLVAKWEAKLDEFK
jgi:membrane protease subunit (stomatin/prohibitin family)